MPRQRPGARELLAIGRALSSEVRIAVLGELLVAEEPMGPARLAERISEPLGNVSYHVGVLVGTGIVELVDRVPRRGAVEHLYRLTPAARERLAPLLAVD